MSSDTMTIISARNRRLAKLVAAGAVIRFRVAELRRLAGGAA